MFANYFCDPIYENIKSGPHSYRNHVSNEPKMYLKVQILRKIIRK